MLTGRFALCLAASLTFACSSPKPLSKPIAQHTDPNGTVTRILNARVTMNIQGAETVSATLPAKLNIVEILGKTPAGKQIPEITWFLSVSSSVPVPLADGRELIFDSDLAPGIYRGPGTYRITTNAQNNTGNVANPFGGGAAYVELVDVKAKTVKKFGRLDDNCTLVATEQQRTGTVKCPKLGSSTYGVVSATWSWELT